MTRTIKKPFPVFILCRFYHCLPPCLFTMTFLIVFLSFCIIAKLPGRSYADAVESGGDVWVTGGWDGKVRHQSSEVNRMVVVIILILVGF